MVVTLNNLGLDRLAFGDLQSARAHLEESAALARDLNNTVVFTSLSLNLGLAAILEADVRIASRHFLDSLAVARVTGAKTVVPNALLGLALVAGAEADHLLAATLHGVADEHLHQAGRSFEALEAGLRDRDHAHLRAAIGDTAFDAGYRHGRTLSQSDAIALASAADRDDGANQDGTSLAPVVPALAEPTRDQSTGALSEREREILALLARGATDAQIAEALFVSVNTVRSHLERIRDKTGARRRPELVRYAARAGIERVVPPG